MPNPYDYNDYNYQNINYMNPQANKGALYGALIAAALSAATGRNTGDSVLKGLAGGVSGYGSGVAATQDYYSQLINDQLRQKIYQQGQREYEETQKPYYESGTRLYDAYAKNIDVDNAMAYRKMIQGELNRPYEQRKQQLDLGIKKNELVKSRKELGRPDKINLGRIPEYEEASGDKRGAEGFLGRYKAFLSTNTGSDVEGDIEKFRTGGINKETKVIGGKRYIKTNNNWYEE